jgi:hypothetical protein
MMQTMESSTVISLEGRRERGRRLARAIDMRRNLDTIERRGRTRSGGRAWLNGQELGGARAAFDHLSSIHD